MDFTLCLTHDCNLRCAYCYAGPKSGRRMTWDTARRAIDFCFDQTLRHADLVGGPPKAQIGYFGGEPLLEWRLLMRSAEYAARQAIRSGIDLKKTVTTNMTLLDATKAAWLKAHGFYLGLSLDGNAAMHDTLRRRADGAGSHADAAKALRFFRGPDQKAEVIVVVDPRNVAHLADAVEWLLAHDALNIALNPNFYRAWPKPALTAWRRACERVGDLYIQMYRRATPVRINVLDGKIKARIKGGYAACDRCGFGEREIAVAASGNIYPCERLVGDDTNAEMRIGNVFDGFDAAKRQSVLACRGNTLAECEDCSARDRCMNWCGCINYATTGAANRVDGIVCHHERMAIAVADRVGATLFAERNPAFLRNFYAAVPI
jgi:uncharacterized protein